MDIDITRKLDEITKSNLEFYKKNEKLFREAVMSEDLQKYDGFYPLIKEKELRDWLEMRWRRDNHAKYRHLFVEWVANLTEGQIAGFRKQMHNDINNVLRTQQ